jgi:carbonic anhydrase
VLGHNNCGAVEAAIKVVQDNAVLPGHLPELIDRVKPAVLAAQAAQPGNLLNAAIVENARRTTQAIVAAQPVVAGLIASGKVKVAGGVYDIATGQVNLL